MTNIISISDIPQSFSLNLFALLQHYLRCLCNKMVKLGVWIQLQDIN